MEQRRLGRTGRQVSVIARGTLSQLALRWILMHPGVTTTIPGAKTPDHARANAAAAVLAPLDADTMTRFREISDARIRPLVHQRW
jgi:aryl-alcohol dehydrogenase-like predicted oxidoreductase